ncbi:hypothetical protein BAUCODRAFT_298803 [Baudoinia panamericana UAMH 10762]|uniref:BTB domain-containing protein n=1 Tax=Baudoinia panamericana (strain UAMH 10762) TaxID=717646 RepID=M2MY61_BAUPA|nr:uncharacterized protein BAUCODRAFT_298803 [Baudoinia panamericana UAMH 10762]EMC91599.1 hypothetical protein BAUCODRAFT_298803 [Baudoinia panamericana UAMH 10762]
MAVPSLESRCLCAFLLLLQPNPPSMARAKPLFITNIDPALAACRPLPTQLTHQEHYMASDVEQPAKGLLQSLKSDRLVKIYVGDEAQPYFVQQLVLEEQSSYFTKALQANAFSEGQTACLRFLDDSAVAWTYFFHWTFRSLLTDGEDGNYKEEDLIQCWIFGDKPATWECLKHGVLNSPPASKLRQLMAEEAVKYVMRTPANRMSMLDQFDGAAGFTSQLFQALTSYNEGAPWLHGRLTACGSDGCTKVWRDYIKGEPPYKHWVYDK